MTPNRLILLSAPDSPWPWLTVTETGAILQRGVLPPDAAPPETPMIDRVIVPGADVVARWLDLPEGNALQTRSAAAFLLEDDIAAEQEAVHVSVGTLDANGRRLATLVGQARIQGWLAEAQARGVTPVSMTPDYLMLRPGLDGETLVAGFGGLLAVRGAELAFSAERPLAETILGDTPRRLLAFEELEPMLARSALEPEIDLLQGAFEPGRSPPQWRNPRRMALLALALLVSPVLLAGARIATDLITTRHMEGRAVASARVAWPRAIPADADIRTVRAHLAGKLTVDQFPSLAAAFFTAVEQTPGAQIDRLAYGQDGLSVGLSYGNYSDMDQLIAAGRRQGLRLATESTVTEGGRITSDISVRRQP
ncbi:PulL Type II secretory pathway, component PulL [Caulobacteraceae bacterium]